MSATLGPRPGGTVDTPRLRIKVNGMALPFPVEATVNSTNTWTAARWSAGVALQDTDQMNDAWWSDQANTGTRVEIDDSIDGVTFTTRLVGLVDEIDIDSDTNYLTLTGRDLTALFIDKKTAKAYQNQTSSEVATELANEAGLTPVVTATTTPVGQFFEYDHVHISLGDLSRSITQWDLLVYLAQQENFDVFVEGTSLFFQPVATNTTPPFVVQHSRINGQAVSNVRNLSKKRSLTLANVNVTVKSWHSGRASPIIAKMSSKQMNNAQGAPEEYVFYKPNLTPDQAAQYANQRMAEITRRERIITFDIPGEVSLTPRDTVQLTGTGTAFDQIYYPDEISRAMHFASGFTETVTALNHSPVNQVVLQ